jgi:rhodanese-related sulfurtransferase
VVQAAAIGLGANAVNPKGLPWIRVPLRETHRVATAEEVRPSSPVRPAARPVEPAPVAVPAPLKVARPPAATPVPDAIPEPAPATVTVPPPAPIVKAVPVPSSKLAPKPAAKNVAHLSPPVKPSPAAPAAVKHEALFTSLTDAKALFDAKDAVFVDARHQADYEAEHIAGARDLFVDEVGTLYEGALGGVPKNRTIVTYCSDPRCDAAIKLADALVARGHTRVFILLEGIPGWRDAGYPTAKGGTP